MHQALLGLKKSPCGGTPSPQSTRHATANAIAPGFQESTLLDTHGIPSPPRFFTRPTHVDGLPSGPRLRKRDLMHLRPMMRRGLLDAYLDWARDQGDDFVVWAGHSPRVVVVRPESIVKVCRTDRGFVRNTMPTLNLFGRGLIRQEGAAWQCTRSVLSPAFSTKEMEGAVTILQEEADDLIALWRGRPDGFKPTRDLSFTMQRVIGRFLFGVRFDRSRHADKRMHRALVTLSMDSVLRHLFPRRAVRAYNGRQVRSARHHLDEICGWILDEGEATALLTSVRAAVGQGKMDRSAAIDNLRTLLIAGHETSASALSWTVALVAQHGSQTAALREECEGAADIGDVEGVQALVETDRWTQEAMRLYPPVPISIWQATRDAQLGDIQVPKGTRVDVCSYVVHRLDTHWPDPDTFEPDRFRTQPERGTYLPFLHGPHTCLGQRLARLEVPLIAARLIEAFEFELPAGPPKVNLRLSLHPSGLRLAVRARPLSPR